MTDQWNHKIFDVQPHNFEALAVEIFHFQYQNNDLYRHYINILNYNPDQVKTLSQIPFLPIRFFKSHIIKTGGFEAKLVFESSGTTGSINSKHHIKDSDLYEMSFLKGIEQVYGSIDDFVVIGLLPSYLEKGGSSLLYMVNKLIEKTNRQESGFYLHDYDKLAATLQKLETKKQKTILIGVTYALLDFAAQHAMPLKYCTIVETGGMKGRKKEMTRVEVHEQLKKSFSISAVHSEYGMTELLSQAWSMQNGLFTCPAWMKVFLRDEEDPLSIKEQNERTNSAGTGAINIIDLANVHSCSFIATDDLGRMYNNNQFEILGRMDNSDMRGCSLMFAID